MEENSVSQMPSTRSVGIRFGLIMGVISIVYFVSINVAGLDMNQGVWRWASLVYVVALIYMAQKHFKDNGDGFMSYGQGVGISFWMGLISTCISSPVSYIYWKFVDDNMIQAAIDQARKNMEEGGKMSTDQIDNAMSITSKFMTPEVFLVTGLIVGVIVIVIVGLIITIFTQKNNPEPSI